MKLERESETLTASVEPGMPDGHQIIFFEEGEPMVDGETGDLVITLRTQPHPVFERRGNDLHIRQSVTLLDALVGFRREVGAAPARGAGSGRGGGRPTLAHPGVAVRPTRQQIRKPSGWRW